VIRWSDEELKRFTVTAVLAIETLQRF